MKKAEILIYITIITICLAIIIAGGIIATIEQTQAEEPLPEEHRVIYFKAISHGLHHDKIQDIVNDYPVREASPVPTEVPTPVPTEVPTPEPTPEPIKMVMMATAYSSAPEENGGYGAVDCRYGMPLPENAIAANLKVLPYGTRVWIDGLGERIVVDTASKATIKKVEAMATKKGADGWIDIYVGDNNPNDWGVRLVTITILEWGTGK